jgi:Protein of unknown function (DUF3575)
MKHLIIILLAFVSALPSKAQKSASADSTWRRNIIKVDITSYWLYRNALMFSYERVVKKRPNQTWGITAGLQEFPALGTLGSDSLQVKKDFNASGFKLGGEYRFYLKKENKYAAPHGVYIGPYTTFHNYSNGRSIEVNNNGNLEKADLKTDLNIFNIGVQLGYQFVLNNRWTIDLVFIGPSISNYSFKTKFDGDFTFDPDEITNEVVLGLIDKFPAFEELINEGEFASGGKINTWAYGYRYQFQIGYHFGRKKK